MSTILHRPVLLLSQTGSPDERRPAPSRQPLRRASRLLPLEQRFMFDGAAVVDAAHAAADAAAAAQIPPAPAAVEVRAAEPAKDNGRKEAVLVDTSLADYKVLEAGVRDGMAIVEFDGTKDGLAQIARWAETQSGYDAIHILSHGSEGQVNLGTALLDDASLGSSTVQAELAGIGHALASDGDLLLYGCEVGAGADGQRFIDNLSAATGADVAASTDATGAADKGGDWTLEAKSGSVEARDLSIDGYHDLLVLVTINGTDADYSRTSFTKTVGGRTFTFSNASNTLGLDTTYGAGSPGLYAYEGNVNGSDIKLTLSVENGYTFDLSSFDVGVVTGTLTIDVTYGNGTTESFSHTGLNNGWQTLSSFNSVSSTINDVKQIVFTSLDFGLFQNFDITDVRAIGPTVTDAKISISGASGTGGAYKIGDTVTATWNNTALGDNNAGITGVTVNFSAFGGGVAVAATESSGTWTATYTITSGSIDLTNRNVSVSATDANGTTTTADTTNATVDNAAPAVTDARISISGASGTGGAYKIGDTVTATWNNTNLGDNNTDISGVTVDFSAFGGGSAVAATNSSGTWTATYTIVSGAIDGSNKNVSVTATDNAGNTFTRADTTNATLDNVAPTVTNANISISGASGTGGAYKIGDTVTATWNNTAGGDNNSDTISSVTVDFSQFGGGSAVAATNSSGTWTATYTIVSGAIDGSNKNVSVTATDNAGNATTTADTTNATLDNVTPTVTNGNIGISGASGTGGAYKIGDTVTATWNNTAGGDNNSDTISSVTVDFSAFGGGAAVAATNSSGTWTATYTIVSGAIDGSNKNVSVTATDNAGNTRTTADTTNATLDNVAPIVTNANISISGASGTGGAYKIGDTVTAAWNNTAGGDNNSDTISGVTVDFSQFGGGSAVAATNSSGTWTATYTIVSGAINGTTNRNVSVTATDNAGNATTTADSTNATVDNVAPSVTFSSLAFSADTGSSSSDFITKTAAQTISATLSGAPGGGDIVYGSLDNGSTWTDITSKVSGTTLTWNGVTLTASNTLKLKVTDAAGNDGTVASQAYTLDTTAPNAPSTPDMSSGTDTGSSSSDNITSDDTPTFTGTAESGSTVTLYDTDGTTVLGTATATGGTWSITASTLSAGSHTLTAKATDSAGNTSSASSGLSVTIDAAAPTGLNLSATTIATISATSTSTIATLSATDSNAITYSLAAGNGTNDADNGSFTIAGTSLKVGGASLTAGTYKIYVAATDAAGNVANQAFTITIVDAPSVNSIVRAGAASSTVNTSATSVQYTVTFSEAVTGVDASDFTLTATGTASGNIASVSGSGTTYTVTVDTISGDGTLRLDLNNSSTGIQNGSSVAIASGYTSGQTYTLDHTAPNAPSTPDMTSGTDTGSSSSDNITSNATPTFSGTAESGSTVTLYDSDGTTVLGTATATGGNWSITSSSLSAGSHTLTAKATDAAGNVSSVSSGLSATIDATAPTVSSVSVPSNGSYRAGQVLSFTVNTSEAVTVDTSGGTPRLALTIGGSTLYAGYASGSGSAALVFTYTVQAGDTDGDGIAVNALQSNGGTLKDTAGNSMTVTLNSVGSTANVLVDTTASAVNSVSVPSNGTYGINQNLDFTVNFDEAVTVDTTGGTPRIAVTLDTGGTVYADYLSGSGTNALVFRHTVLAGEDDGTGVTIGALGLNGGTLKDAAGNDATLTLNSVGSTASVLVDTTAPTNAVASAAFSADTGASGTDFITKTAAQTISGTLSANLAAGESVYVSLDNGATWTQATATTGQNTWSLAGQTLAGSGTLKVKVSDTAGNDGAVHSQAYVLDTTAPGITFSGLALSADTGASSTDFVTGVAAQTITATLSGAPGGGDIVYGSLDNGATWTDITNKVSGTALTWNGVTLAGSDTLKLKVTDAAGNDGATAGQAYVLDTTASATTVASAAFSADTGASGTDFITKTAAQTVSGTLSANLASGETVYVSLDNGASWVAATAAVGQATWSLGGQTLVGSGTLKVKVSDAAGNDGAVHSQAYVLDTAPPAAPTVDALTSPSTTPTLTGTATLGSGESMTVTVGSATYNVTPSGGAWSLDLATATPASGTLDIVAGHTYTVTAAITDVAGNVGAVSGALGIVVPPPPPTAEAPAPAPSPAPAPAPAEVLPAAAAPTVSFLSASAESAINGNVSAPSTSTSSFTTLPSAPAGTASPGTVPSVAESRAGNASPSVAPPTLTQGGSGHFQVVVTSGAQAGGDGLMVNRGLPDQQVGASGRTEISIPADAFAHTNPNAAIQLSARQANGQPLPNWVRFDARDGKFVVQAPAGVRGELTIRVVARDAQGHEVASTFKIRVGGAQEKQGLLDRPSGRPGLSEQVRIAAAARQPAAPASVAERLARTSGTA